MSYTTLLSPDKDPMGNAIAEYFSTKKADKLRVLSSQFDEDEIPVSELFRKANTMPPIEKIALKMATGKILDVGAGSGCHSLALQKSNKSVTAIDISPLSVETMKKQGVKDARQINLFDESFCEKFDTILMLMNGSGIIGKIANMPKFFERAKDLLAPNGKIIMDSSDLKYLFEEEDGSYMINIAGNYYGEIDFEMQYKNIKGDSFSWLYIDFETLKFYAEQNGFSAEIIRTGKHYNYLAALQLATEEEFSCTD